MTDQSVMKKSLIPPMSSWWTAYVATWIVKVLAKFAKRRLKLNITVHNKQAVPRKGPVEVVGGHYSNVDALLWGSTIPRNGAILAKHSLWLNPFTGWLVVARGDIPVWRKSAWGRARAQRKAEKVIANGGLVGSYPTAGCNHHGEERMWRKGFAERAIKYQSTIVVIRLKGSGWLMPLEADREIWGGKILNCDAKVEVIYSDPITPDMYAGMDAEQLTAFVKDIHDNLEIPTEAAA